MVASPKKPKVDGFLNNAIQHFANYKTGWGTDCDNANAISQTPVIQLSPPSLQNAYRSNTLIRKIVDYLPERAAHTSCSIEDLTGTLDAEQIKEYEVKLRRLKFKRELTKASKKARLYGDFYLVLGIDDGLQLSDPVDFTRIKSVNAILPVYHDYITPLYETLLEEEPEYYYYNIRGLGKSLEDLTGNENNLNLYRIHKSRVIHIKGIPIDRYYSQTRDNRNDSVIQTLLQSCLIYEQAIGAANSMLVRSGIFVYKIFGLEDYAVANDEEAIQNRFSFINAGISVFKSLFIDAKKGEEAEYVTQNFGGVDKLLNAIQDHMIAQSGYPRSVILGSSNASAFSEGGNSDRLTMAELVRQYQYEHWQPAYEKLLKLLCASQELPGTEECELTANFGSALHVTAKEQAELEKIVAESDKIRIESGVITANESRSRYLGDSFDLSLSIEGLLEEDDEEEEEDEEDPTFAPQ